MLLSLHKSRDLLPSPLLLLGMLGQVVKAPGQGTGRRVMSSKHEGVHLVLYLLVTKAVAIAVLQTHSKHEDVHLVLYRLVTQAVAVAVLQTRHSGRRRLSCKHVTQAVAVAVLQTHSKHEDVYLILHLWSLRPWPL